jgi:glycine oxidase
MFHKFYSDNKYLIITFKGYNESVIKGKNAMNFPDKSDVLIVGGGVIGLTLARELHKKGVRKITVVERGLCGMEASSAAAGMLAPHAETDKIDPFFQFCAESNRLYPGFAAELLDETGIDIELDQAGTLYLALTERDSEELRRRYEWQKSAGLKVEHLTAAETRQTEPFISPDVRESLFFADDGQVENRLLVQALLEYTRLNGIEIREGAEVSGLLTSGSRVLGVETRNEKLFAETTVVATGAWTSLIKLGPNAWPVKIKPIKGQMIAFHTAKRLFQKVIYSPRGYIVPRADGRILAGATVEDAGFDKQTTEAGIEYLRGTAGEISPSLGSFGISESWAGLRPFAADTLPVIGRIIGYENLLIATAHYRNGILLAPITARVLADEITGTGTSEYLELFGIGRFQAVGTAGS